MSSAADVLKLDVSVASREEDVLAVVLKIRPLWEPRDISIEPIHGGLVNRLWKVRNKCDDDDVIAVKIFGDENNALFDRQRELQLMEDLHRKNISLPLYARFRNGFAYKFMRGSTLSPQQLFDENVSRLVIKKMHAVQDFETVGYTASQPLQLIKTLLVPWTSNHTKIAQIDGFDKYFNYEEFGQVINGVLDTYAELNEEFPPHLCHKDMHVLNLVYDEERGELAVVDWEVCDVVPPVEDIARHFCVDPDGRMHDAGISVPERKDYIEKFIRMYLETHPQHGQQPVSQKLVDKWLLGTYKAMHLTLVYTTVWLLAQHLTRSDADFFRIACVFERTRRITADMLKSGLV